MVNFLNKINISDIMTPFLSFLLDIGKRAVDGSGVQKSSSSKSTFSFFTHPYEIYPLLNLMQVMFLIIVYSLYIKKSFFRVWTYFETFLVLVWFWFLML